MEEFISDDHALEYLLAFDGRVHYFERGFWLKFEIKRVAATPERPHGLRYSFTLHDPRGKRLLGFDNAHGVPERGSRFNKSSAEHDHWHRTGHDAGEPYAFTTIDRLLVDFQTEVVRVLAETGIDDAVVGEGDLTERQTR
jgi:hypothetical protein